ncbi:uncharacterized protein L3040_004779 [Drepanopeziza brunnea f. sp. 'multigermtubi']|uniref:Argonaute siRNA chaperone complex subunit Arb1 n=1 Tax=Marssonina brunnea f. sp. multigermtubi (strain MB_m1) TaxID=1072389 RepID=K1WZZ8_MARBU|nr:argonaute siRNA chaperone complex subunit Arb1 [Drepanopeziza brunnea f. sp. 'multigermtubi' MB_m1]EKD18262.1 argonaute siRNA chaperone complex subunit Arb1 [Drepanopeziza brunnea f. sp. 'multigermtubi' MB_m1]KAJ5042225.1 hypothetical protein L3040_004779 [Drepanopeziza brunnea f. sp. 'multigermtubi']
MSSPPDQDQHQHQATSLSKAVSQIDLNAALNAVQAEAATGLRYTQDTLLALRPKTKDEKRAEVEHVEVAALSSPDGDQGIMTPPYRDSPAPPPPTPATPLSNGAEPVASTDVAGAKSTSVAVGVEAPKKKKKKGGSGKNKKAPVTGFEEFYADPPITPAEQEEEEDLYEWSRPVPERIETAIQRYRGRRKLDEHRSNILTKYLMLGGVEATAKAFTGGLDKETIENSTAAEIAAIQASDYVQAGTKNSKYYDGSDDWVVDFEGVAKGFFSHRVPRIFPLDCEKDIMAITNVIRNFLNYILQHEVVPEFTKDIMAARALCDLAEQELWAIHVLNFKLPGDFGIAASTLYGGRFKGLCLENEGWVKEDPNFAEMMSLNQGFSDEKASRIFMTSVAFAGDDELFVKTSEGNLRIVKTEVKFLEAIKIKRASVESIETYAGVTDHEGKPGKIKPLGSIWYKAWEGPGFDDEDLTDEEIEAAKIALATAPVEKFWLEDDILQDCFEGMKIEATVHELNTGLKFIDSFKGVFCSFHTILPNEKLVGWKEPVPNTRPPPTVDDPELEERAMEAIMEDDLKHEEKEFAKGFEGKK